MVILRNNSIFKNLKTLKILLFDPYYGRSGTGKTVKVIKSQK